MAHERAITGINLHPEAATDPHCRFFDTGRRLCGWIARHINCRKSALLLGIAALLAGAATATTGRAEETGATVVQTPYTDQQVIFDFYFDEPEKINSALYWIRSLMNPLMESPYDMAPEFLDLKVIVHGTEIVALASKNYARYHDAVERMRYYAQLGVEFRVCGLAAADYGYEPEDFYDFVKVVPSAITELAHWQLQGYALITPTVMEKRYTIEEIR
jgi:intracellular sulfur oxidation DsrE/DsrF family protein